MSNLSNFSPAATYPNILQLNTNGQGLQTFPLNVQDGLGNNTVMTLWTTGINFSRAGGNQFQLDGVALTASAATLNNLNNVANSSYLLTNLDGQLPNANLLLAAPGLSLVPGVQSYTITPTSELLGVQNMNGLPLGFVARTGVGVYTPRSLTSDGTLTITNPAATAGNPFIQVTPASVVELVNVQRSGIHWSTRPTLNFIPANANIGITVIDNAGNQSADILISGTGGGGGGGVATVVGTPNQVTAVTDAFFNVTVGLPNSVIVNTSLIAGNMELTANNLSSVNANGPVILEPSGTGAVQLMNATLFQPVPLQWYNAAGTFFSALKASNALAASTTWTLPVADSVGTQALVSNGAGQLSWSTGAGAITSVVGTANQVTVNTVGSTATVSLPNSVIIPTSVQAGNLEIIGNTLEATNVNGNVILSPQGTGSVQLINGTNANPVPLQWYNAAGTFFSAFTASNALAASTTWTLPTADSVGTQALVSNGAGQLSWVTGGGGITSVVGTVSQITVNTVGTVATVSLPNSVIITSSVQAGNLSLSGNIVGPQNANGNLIMVTRGTGTIQIQSLFLTNAVPLQWYNAPGTFFSAFVASNALISSTTWTLPISDSVGTQALVSNGAGQLFWESTGTITWTNVTTAAQALATNNGYVTNRAGGVTYTLPATANLGDSIQIVANTGIATIAQNAGQNIFIGAGSTTTGVAGTLTANTQNDSVTLICIEAGANTLWRATNVDGFWITA